MSDEMLLCVYTLYFKMQNGDKNFLKILLMKLIICF